jgi:AbrB family looped-hinge helix DNA binding protein
MGTSFSPRYMGIIVLARIVCPCLELRQEVGQIHYTLPTIHNPTTFALTDFIHNVILKYMNTTEKLDTVWFTTKGQVVIPLRLRKEFDIEDGTKAVVQATPEGILLKPVTAALIKRGRGILKRTRGGKPLTADWAEHKEQERALEERHAR